MDALSSLIANPAFIALAVAVAFRVITWVAQKQGYSPQYVLLFLSVIAGGGTVRHVATSITLCYSDTAIAGVSQVNLRDGATGAGTILRSWFISVPVAGEARCENLTGLNITGSANTAMTLEFGAATAATSSKTVSLTGYSTP